MRSKKRKNLPKPVISIGNMTMGGTGKTPLLIYLANELQAQGREPAILSRGYGHDEIMLTSDKCPGVPIGVGENRFSRGIELLNRHSIRVFLLDDGFQHWPLARSLDIVCVDVTSPLCEERLLPRGNLREPASGLARAGVVVLTRTELVTPEALQTVRAETHNLAPNSLILTSHFAHQLTHAVTSEPAGWDVLQNKPVLTVSAIGNPAAFEDSLKKQRVSVTPVRYRDHHSYSRSDVDRLMRVRKEISGALVTTEKDWVKLKIFEWKDTPVYVLKIQIEFDPSDGAKLKNVVNRVFQ